MALSEKQIDYSGNSTTSMEQLFLANEKDLYIASRSLKAMGHPPVSYTHLTLPTKA